MEADLIVGHGSGSFGHVAALRHGIGTSPVGPDDRIGVAATRHAASRLHQLVIDALIDAGAAPISFAAGSALVSTRGRLGGGTVEPLERILGLGLLPVTGGDVVFDRVFGAAIASTEEVFRYLIGRLRRRGRPVARVLWAGTTEGVFDGVGRLVPTVDGSNVRSLERAVGGSAGHDVTGGMLLRLRTAWRLARLGVDSWIFDGTVPGRLERALENPESVPGTRVTN